MCLLNIIEEKIKKIKNSENIEILELVFDINNNNINFLDLENTIDYKFEDEFKELYLKYSYIKIVWEIKKTEERGYFELIKLTDIYEKTREMLELYKEIISTDKYIKIKYIAEDLYNWIPIFNFPNGDLFCIDRRNDKIVFFDHELLDGELNLHGLVIAKNIYELIEKWSKVLYIDIYDWYEGVNEQGIDLDRDVYKNILYNQ